jgi:hypothetical protein
MLNRYAILAAVCMLIPLGTARLAVADPPPAPGPAAQPAGNPAPPGPPPPPNGDIPSSPPGVLDTPDGWHLNVVGSNEDMTPVAPLTTAISSREYLVSGTFTGKVSGGGKTKLNGGTLEAGYQIGCGIIADEGEVNPTAAITPSLSSVGVFSFGESVNMQGKVYLKPGVVNIVPVDKKSFKDTGTRVSITGYRIKIDDCAGQSFIRSYATLTSSTDNTDDVITYLGVTEAV